MFVCCVCRLLEVLAHRIVEIHDYEKPVSELYTQKVYRIEVKCVFIMCTRTYIHNCSLLQINRLFLHAQQLLTDIYMYMCWYIHVVIDIALTGGT